MDPETKKLEQPGDNEKSIPLAENDGPPPTRVRQAYFRDLETIKKILGHWIRTPDGEIISQEVDQVLENITNSIRQAGTADEETIIDRHTYLVVEVRGITAGVIGFRPPSPEMVEFCQTDNPVEIINAYIDPNIQHEGLGTKLFMSLVEEAYRQQRTEVVVNSGPRYQSTGGWAFWDKMLGEPVGELKDFYGLDIPARVWRGSLPKNTNP